MTIATSSITVTILDVETSKPQGRTLYTIASADFLGETVFLEAYGKTAEVLQTGKPGQKAHLSTEITTGTPKIKDGKKNLFGFKVTSIDLVETQAVPQLTQAQEAQIEAAEIALARNAEAITRLENPSKKDTKVAIANFLRHGS